ncbi:MAG TPA: hypothetical protein VN323_22110 [Candidatus Dormibacteraeota bacterium]|jgi:hypothetical protein|nr:hypothetical protein [Candidatus Dormibacteraeota bacterium]
MTRRVALIMLLGLSVSAPVAAAETWVLWARPCDLAGQTCTGDWQRRETFDAERWCKAALTTAVNKALTSEARQAALTKGVVLEYRCLPEQK